MRQHGAAPLSLSVRIPRPSLPKAFRTALLLAALPLNTSIAFAQGAGGAKSPATAIEIERMVSIASINMCILSKSKVPFVTAMQANMVPMVSCIKEVNSSPNLSTSFRNIECSRFGEIGSKMCPNSK